MTQFLLALETSGRTGSLALLADGELREELRLDETGRRHAQSLVAELQELLKRHRLAPRDLAAVAVSRGPGSFTGLRVGIVCAKTLAWAAGLKLLAIETFAAIAEAAPRDAAVVHVVDDAQRGELFVGTFQRAPDGTYAPLGEVSIHPVAAWVASVAADALVLGPAVPALRDQGLAARAADDPSQNLPRAGIVAALAWRRFRRGEADDLWTVAPFYLRASAAEEKWAQTHGPTGPST